MESKNPLKDNLMMQNENKVSVFGYIAMLVMLYLTDSAFVAYGPQSIYYVSMLACIGIAAYAIFKCTGIRNFSQTFVIFGLMIIWIAVYSFLGGSGEGQTLKYVSLLIISVYVSYAVKFEKFMKVFTDVCFFLAVVAIFMWIIAFAFPTVYDMLPMIKLKPNVDTVKEMFEYRTLFFANMHKASYMRLARLTSIFWEPGVCQAYFNIALIYTIRFMEGKRQLIYSIVFVVAVVLTLSTGGYLALACVMGLVLFSKSSPKKSGVTGLRVLMFFGIIVLAASFSAFKDSDLFVSVFGKLSGGTEDLSVSSRLNSISGNFYVLGDNLLIGAGLNKTVEALKEYGIYTSQTNTILDYFATFGIIIGSIYTISWGFFIKKLGGNFIQTLCILGAFICIFFNEDFIGSIHFYILMLYGARYWLDGDRKPLEEGCI